MSTVHTIIVLLLVLAFGLLAWFVFGSKPTVTTTEKLPLVLSFEDCAAAGYPVMESYPRQCNTPDGRHYTEELPTPEIVYVNANPTMINVENPTPGSVTGKQFTVMGEARGTWFFEASFPVKLLDVSGNVLSQGIAQAQGEWMTEEFVPFVAQMPAFTATAGTTGKLVLEKDNPSGMPENAANIEIPVNF